MKTLYLMRHGQTIFNQQKKIQGWSDSPLTEFGRKQAIISGQYFSKNNIVFDGAYSSTSERASDTLELVTKTDYSRVKGLKEWNFGSLEAEHEYLNPPLPYKDFFVAFGGEEEAQFQERVSETIFELMKAEQGECIMMVSHGAACRQFMRKWAHTSDIDQKKPLGNCCILKFEFAEDQFRLLEIINHDFSVITESSS
ncbi:phosphoglycerate mutase family protein [Enterococcus sp. BWT-B8]|uniref:histidine phosphatase family protein n=1 Tax=Enterococcus sp. BWT-B8 TaxID=2885157 RepID=UPI001E65BC5F|nr:histidine phosphatase family protein [Enterococcus sp. BWT-B8]MCB5953364.1 phosphoglycerate mutase family protein [Enterococcus sp. BWT-B8]